MCRHHGGQETDLDLGVGKTRGRFDNHQIAGGRESTPTRHRGTVDRRHGQLRVTQKFLEEPANRGAVQIARNLLEGAAVVTRAQQLRSYGVPVPARAFHFEPRPLA